MNKKESSFSYYDKIISIIIAGIMAGSLHGCTDKTKDASDNKGLTITKETWEYEQFIDKAVLSLCYKQSPKKVEALEEYNFEHILDINGKLILSVLLSENTFTRDISLFDGKDSVSKKFFYSQNNQIIIPDMYNIDDQDIAAKNKFFDYFRPEVTYRIFKGATKNSGYFLEKTIKYTLLYSKDTSKYGNEITLKTVSELNYNRTKNILSATTIYRKQDGIGADCENVKLSNFGQYECLAIQPRDIDYYDRTIEQYIPVMEDMTIQDGDAIKLRRSK